MKVFKISKEQATSSMKYFHWDSEKARKSMEELLLRQKKRSEMRRLFIIGAIALMAMGIALFMAGCSSVKHVPVESRTDSVYIEKLIPMVNPADSAAIRALFECDENGRVVLRWLDIANTKNVQAQLTIDSLGNVIAKMKVPQDTVYIPSKKITVKEYVEVPVEVEKKLTRWQAMKVELGGWAFGIIIGFLLFIVGWLLYKRLKR